MNGKGSVQIFWHISFGIEYISHLYFRIAARRCDKGMICASHFNKTVSRWRWTTKKKNKKKIDCHIPVCVWIFFNYGFILSTNRINTFTGFKLFLLIFNMSLMLDGWMNLDGCVRYVCMFLWLAGACDEPIPSSHIFLNVKEDRIYSCFLQTWNFITQSTQNKIEGGDEWEGLLSIHIVYWVLSMCEYLKTLFTLDLKAMIPSCKFGIYILYIIFDKR